MDTLNTIIKYIFNFSNESDFGYIIKYINNYARKGIEKITIENILGIFSFIRPKQGFLLIKIKEIMSLESNINLVMETKVKQILNFGIFENCDSVIKNILINDNMNQLQNVYLQKNEFQNKSNFLDIAAYYGSIKSFKFLLTNDFPLSNYVLRFAVAGGNEEIIDLLSNNNITISYECLQLSIYYHRYNIFNKIQNYYDIDISAAICSFNYDILISYENLIFKTFEESKFMYICCISENFMFLKYFYNQYNDSNKDMEDIIWYAAETQKEENKKQAIISIYIDAVIKDIEMDDLFTKIRYFGAKLEV